MAFKAGKYRIGFNTKANAFTIIMQIVMLVLWFYVGDQIISIIQGITNTSTITDGGATYVKFVPETNIFYNGFKLLGLKDQVVKEGLTGYSASSGLVSIVGLLLAVAVLMQAIRITRV